MKSTIFVCCVLSALLLPIIGSAKPSKKASKEVATCYVLHADNIYADRIGYVQDSLAQLSGKQEERFLGAIASLACNFIAGKIITTAQGAATKAMERSKARFTAEWNVAAKKDYFYNNISTNGYMDLNGLSFNGFRVVRAVPNEDNTKVDTAFYLACRLDTTKLVNLVKNSTFELTLDTLKLDLSKTKAKLPDDRDFKLDVTIKVLASWATKSATYFRDQELGTFHLTLPVSKEQANGAIYVCTKNIISGSSFTIPRSYSGSITEDVGSGRKRTTDLWGQGEYTIEVSVKEQTESKSMMRDLLYEYLQEVNKLAGTTASEYVKQYTTFDEGSTAKPAMKK